MRLGRTQAWIHSQILREEQHQGFSQFFASNFNSPQFMPLSFLLNPLFKFLQLSFYSNSKLILFSLQFLSSQLALLLIHLYIFSLIFSTLISSHRPHFYSFIIYPSHLILLSYLNSFSFPLLQIYLLQLPKYQNLIKFHNFGCLQRCSFFKEGAKRESESFKWFMAHNVCGKMRPIIIESDILFDYTFPDIFAQNLFFFLVFKFEMEFCQLNKGVSSVQEEGNASFSLDEGPSVQYDDMLNKLIENLLDQKIDPFIVYSHDSIKAQPADIEPQDANIKDKILGYCRKQKSLAELSRRFVNRFEGTGKNVIALDQVTAELKVERRRIYDIINIMESLGVVSKIKKNLYQWNGLIEAIETIRIYAEGKQPVKPEKNKKEKSLESLASEFLKLFINFSGVLTLDEAADQILKSSIDTDSRKTKIRRLYDIVNVFKCIELVQKISISGEKSGFRWKGCNELLKFIEEKNSSPFHSYDQVSEESFDKISLSEKMSVTKKTTEEFKSNRIEDTIQTKVRQDIEVIEFKRSEEQMKESEDEMQGMSYFQQMVLKMNPEKKREFDLKAEFKKQMWPIQEGIGEIQY